jgi:lysophospholipase L1-like esterase
LLIEPAARKDPQEVSEVQVAEAGTTGRGKPITIVHDPKVVRLWSRVSVESPVGFHLNRLRKKNPIGQGGLIPPVIIAALLPGDCQQMMNKIQRTGVETFEIAFVWQVVKVYIAYWLIVQDLFVLSILVVLQTLLELFVLIQSTKPSPLSAYNFARNRLSKKSSGRDPPILLCLGDSITHGRCSYDWVSSLTQQIHRGLGKQLNSPPWSDSNAFWVVCNAQNSITTFTALVERLDWTLQCLPDLVVILIGTNDARALVDQFWNILVHLCWKFPSFDMISVERIEANLRGILEKLLLEPKRKVAICTIPPLGEDLENTWNKQGVDPVNRVIRKVAHDYDQTRVVLLDLHAALESAIRSTPNRRPTPPHHFYLHILWQAYGRHILGLSWDSMSIDNVVMHDTVHLNERGGHILENFVVKWFSRNTNIMSDRRSRK